MVIPNQIRTDLALPVAVQAANRPDSHRVQKAEEEPVDGAQPRGYMFGLIERHRQHGHQYGHAQRQVYSAQMREQHVDRRTRLENRNARVR